MEIEKLQEFLDEKFRKVVEIKAHEDSPFNVYKYKTKDNERHYIKVICKDHEYSFDGLFSIICVFYDVFDEIFSITFAFPNIRLDDIIEINLDDIESLSYVR